RVTMLGAGEGGGAALAGVGRNRGLDGGPKLAIALDEFGHPGGEPEHVLEHEVLAIAGDASANADGRDFDGSRDAAGERLGHRLDHDRKSAAWGTARASSSIGPQSASLRP